MRRGRIRGLGCLGCLPFGGLFILLLPLILIGLVIYFLVNRQRMAPPGPPAPYNPAPPAATGGAYCNHCGKPLEPGAKFCAGCGSAVM